MGRKNIFTRFLLFSATALLLTILASQDGSAASVESVIAGHDTCEQCHGLFPGGKKFRESGGEKDRPAKIPSDRIDLLCLGCHGPAGISNLKADVHGMQNYVIKRTIGCITCHDPHDNNPNYLGGQNIKLIGEDKLDKASHLARIKTTGNGKQYVVFESRGTDAGDSSLYSFADGDEDNNNIFDGICEACHTRTKYHRNNPSGDHEHYRGNTCTDCHLHIDQFLAFTENVEGVAELSGTVVDESGLPLVDIIVFLDINGNGVYDDGEPVAVTDANGNFTFQGVTNLGHAILVMPGSLPNGYRARVNFIDGELVITAVAETMAYPVRLSWDGTGGYFMSDFLRDAVFFYDGSDTLKNKLGGLDKPLGITADGAGNIYVGNQGRKNLEIYNAAGQLLQVLGDGQLQKPTEVVLDRDGRVYVADSAGKNVQVFNPDGTDALTISQDGSSQSFRFPISVAVQYRMDGGVEVGEIYIADRPSSLIHVYDLQGNYLRSLGGNFNSGMLGPTISNDRMMNIQSIAFDQYGNLHVLDGYMSRVKVFDPVDGTAIGYYDTFQAGQGSQQPLDIAINAAGQVIMTSFKTKSVQNIHTVQ